MKRNELFMTALYDQIKQRIGARLRDARRAAQLTQQDVADRIGVTQSQYNHYESGRTLISIDQLLKLEEIFGRSITFLVGKEICFIADLPPLLQELVELTKKLDPDSQEQILDFAQYVANRKDK
jgi:HTH-type transcriptional regulator/antitoxin HipB